MENLDLYRCEICGNIIQIMHSGDGEIVCCGQPMKKLIAKIQEEALTEKHVPIFVNHPDNETEIRIGEILHPMTQEHFIKFIQVISEDKMNVETKFLNPSDEPKFYTKNSNFKLAREYCNLHGLWEGKND